MNNFYQWIIKVRYESKDNLAQNKGLTRTYYEIITGLLLGDCNAQKKNIMGGACLRFSQSIKHASYLMTLYDLFQSFVSTPPRSHIKKMGEKMYIQLSFQTKILPYFTSIYYTFYDIKGG